MLLIYWGISPYFYRLCQSYLQWVAWSCLIKAHLNPPCKLKLYILLLLKFRKTCKISSFAQFYLLKVFITFQVLNLRYSVFRLSDSLTILVSQWWWGHIWITWMIQYVASSPGVDLNSVFWDYIFKDVTPFLFAISVIGTNCTQWIKV